jgi:glutaredoxin 3
MSQAQDFVDLVKQKNASNPVIVYSRSWCPYCTQVKGLLLHQLNVPTKVIEMDQLADEAGVAAALTQITGRTSVPQVFIGGAHVGGCDGEYSRRYVDKLQDCRSSCLYCTCRYHGGV